jgi:class 3 adenylate cyclase
MNSMNQARQLAAIMFTDIVGYTAMMQANEQRAVAVIKHYNSSLEKLVQQYNGQVLNYYGDGSLCIFPSATDAINCSLALQKELKNEPAVPLRIGLHIGEVFFEDAKALGDGVNVASRVQSLGQENTILVSGEIHDKIKNNPSFSTISLGQFNFKNVDKPLEIFALSNEGLTIPKRSKIEGKLKKKTGTDRSLLQQFLSSFFLRWFFCLRKIFC